MAGVRRCPPADEAVPVPGVAHRRTNPDSQGLELSATRRSPCHVRLGMFRGAGTAYPMQIGDFSVRTPGLVLLGRKFVPRERHWPMACGTPGGVSTRGSVALGVGS